MTGPEHYRRAEQLIAAVDTGFVHEDGTPILRDEPTTIALAQVHASLAVAAAIGGLGPFDGYATVAWREVGAIGGAA